MVAEEKSWLGYHIGWMRKVLRVKATSHPSVDVPYAQHVVIAATSQLLSIRTPLQTANFLSMILVGAHKTVSKSNVVSMNH